MKKRTELLPGLILLGIGLYFFLRQLDLPLVSEFLIWPLLLVIVGLAFIICSFAGWDKQLSLPGGITLFLGLHFLFLHTISDWPSHWAMYPGAIGCGFLLAYFRTRHNGYLAPAIILLTIPVLFLLFDHFDGLYQWWPILLIIIGLVLILRRKK